MLGGLIEDHPDGSFTDLRRMLTGSSHGSHPLSEWALGPTRYGSKRSAEAFAVGARYGVRMTRSPASCRRVRIPSLHFASRSQINTRHVPVSAIVRVRATWAMKASSGCGVEPRIWTRRELTSMTKTV